MHKNNNKINHNNNDNNWIYHAFTHIELETIFFCLGVVERMVTDDDEKVLNEFLLKDINFKNITKEKIQRVKKKLERI